VLFDPEPTTRRASASGRGPAADLGRFSEKVRIFFWNLRHGGGRRLPEIAIALRVARADVVALCEFRRNPGASLRAVLADAGLTHQFCTAPHSPSRVNGMLIASRTTLRDTTPPSVPHADRPRLAMVALDEFGLRLTAAHIPCVGRERRHNAASARAWQAILNTCKTMVYKDHAVLGDLNADRDPTVGARADAGSVSLGRLTSLGYVDACAPTPDARRSDARAGTTWLGPRGERARLDYAWLSPALAPRLARAEPVARLLERGVSDHAGLMIDLAPSAANR